MEELDVKGARAAGLYPAHYLPDGEGERAMTSDAKQARAFVPGSRPAESSAA